MERQEKVDFEPVGRIAPQATPPGGVSEAIAARLRPLDNTELVESFGTGSTSGGNSYANAPTYGYTVPRMAATMVGRMTSDPPRRTNNQSGMAATNLMPNPPNAPSVMGQALPPSTSGGVGVANLPALPFFR
jgi:hypothetical protein